MMANTVKLIADRLRKIEVKSPSQLIIEQIRGLVADGVLKPGQKLPSERIMSERFGVSRGIVREALRRLEFYGVLRTLPQSGTVLENIGAPTLAVLIDNILEIPGNDFATLAEARLVIETHTARLAALQATDAQIAEIRQVHTRFSAVIDDNRHALEENMLFHLRIAGASGNTVLRSFVSQIEPEIMKFSIQFDAYRDNRMPDIIAEHEAVVSAIERRDADAAAAAMARHLENARYHDAALVAEDEDEFPLQADAVAGRRRRRATRRSPR
ncbi:MAG: FadR/GntR family transcriptional regulator [Rhodospirillales bacterium]|jgi:GntR family transcriptional repressor for pyruvate dehydrogenase complex|nr:FadR/GntR family transcriptional regulator [Rhodospirillales bacterium]